jgi:hypothetical protein
MHVVKCDFRILGKRCRKSFHMLRLVWNFRSRGAQNISSAPHDFGVLERHMFVEGRQERQRRKDDIPVRRLLAQNVVWWRL